MVQPPVMGTFTRSPDSGNAICAGQQICH